MSAASIGSRCLNRILTSEGDYFTELIKPLAVHTAQLIVGTNSQQMDLTPEKVIEPEKIRDEKHVLKRHAFFKL